MKRISYLLLSIVMLTGCDFNFFFKNSDSGSVVSISESESQSIKNSDSITNSENLEYDEFLDVSDVNLFVNEKYYIDAFFNSISGIKLIYNSDLLSYKDGYLSALDVGNTTLKFVLNGYYQEINITITKEDVMQKDFAFNMANLYGKKLVCFGDSVTADATIANEGSEITYPWLLKNNMKMASVKNYAIGGTTGTYTYFGSNIYKEYATNQTAIDGPRVVKKAYENNELNDVDYAIIAYGHNDQYFQPPLDNESVTDELSLENCLSFKQSYRYMIGMIKKASPNCRIILLNCTYSQYGSDTYGKKYTYQDYRDAIKEIAEEYNLKCIDPWTYMEAFYKKSGYYRDVVHLNKYGQAELYKFIITQ